MKTLKNLVMTLKTRVGGVKKLITCLALMAVATLALAVSRAPSIIEETHPQQPVRARDLGGHLFVRSALLAFPFAMSQAGSMLEVGYANFSQVTLEAPVKTMAFGPQMYGQAAFGNFGLELGFSTSIQSGLDAYSALIFGAGFQFTPRVTLRWAFLKTSKFAMSASVAGSYGFGTSFSPLTAASSALTTLALINGSNFFVFCFRWETIPQLDLAFAPVRWLGFVAQAGGVIGGVRTPSNYAPSFAIRAGAGLSLSLVDLVRALPLTIQVNCRNDFLLSATSALSPILNIGIFERFKRDFHFGLEGNRLLGGAADSISGSLTLQYFY